jgi:hypothetical protein
METWTWGSLHNLEFRHPLGDLSRPAHAVQCWPLTPTADNNTTVQNSGFSFTAPYGATVGSIDALICDMASRIRVTSY